MELLTRWTTCSRALGHFSSLAPTVILFLIQLSIRMAICILICYARSTTARMMVCVGSSDTGTGLLNSTFPPSTRCSELPGVSSRQEWPEHVNDNCSRKGRSISSYLVSGWRHFQRHVLYHSSYMYLNDNHSQNPLPHPARHLRLSRQKRSTTLFRCRRRTISCNKVEKLKACVTSPITAYLDNLSCRLFL